MTLLDHVTFWMKKDCRKHELASDPDAYAEEKVNEMTNMELLIAISEALEEEKP